MTEMNRKTVFIALGFSSFMLLTFIMLMSRQETLLKTFIDRKTEEIVFSAQSRPDGQHQKIPIRLTSSNNFRKLTQVSEGFKDNIDDSQARSYLKKYRDLFAASSWKGADGTPNDSTSIQEWWQAAAMIDWYINSPLRYKCANKKKYGNWHVCQDKPYEVKPPCLVYSFGIAKDFSFDDAMGKLGCEVHSFDPSMGEKDHKRSANVTFHNLGLGFINTNGYIARQDMYVEGRKLWKVRTVKQIKEMLGHKNRVIDVFKMDVEGYEWNVIDNMMETGMFGFIRQYMLEFHLFPDQPLKEDYVNCYNIYRRLREMGLREYSIGPHPKTLKADKFNNQGDSEFINVNFGRR